MEEAKTYAILLFILLSLTISITFKDQIKSNQKKHLLAAIFMFMAAIIYMVMIILML